MVTILGASGFVGSHLVDFLKERAFDFYAPHRDEDLTHKFLGDVIYCIGLTADFRSRPYDTVDAHVCKLKHVLLNCDFKSLTYLSSTRLYIHNLIDKTKENSDVLISVQDPFDLYNCSKLLGELLLLNSGKSNVKIARLSNVYGTDFNSDNFLTSIIKDAVLNQKVILKTTPDSSKDYISVEDVVGLLLKISMHGKETIYNVASGFNTSNKEILEVVQNKTNCTIEYDNHLKQIIFPSIDVEKIKDEFDYVPAPKLLTQIGDIIETYKTSIAIKRN